MAHTNNEFSVNDERVNKTISSLRTRNLCDHCLGRIVGKVGHGYTNDTRGRIIRAGMDIPQIVESSCILCEGLFTRLDEFQNAIVKKLSEIEFETFSLGSRYDPAIIEREESIWSECGSEFAEPIKVEINREVGKRVEKTIGKSVDTKNADVVAIFDVNFLDIDLEISSLFIYGRYRKLDRTIPQTRWPCRMCQGKGCERCGFTGKMYQESVEELIRKDFMDASKAEDSALHGMGREDIDARMVGNGRPFVLELKRPKHRSIDINGLSESTNDTNRGRVEIIELRLSSKDEVHRIKDAETEKSYRVTVEFPDNMASEKLLNAFSSLRQSPIEQRTPQRVSHRRSNKVRVREVKEIELESLYANRAVIRLRTSSGTYIKELMHGDEGRTVPSLAGLLGVSVEVKELDVIGIHDRSDSDGQVIEGNEA